MPIRFKCPHCHKPLSVKEHLAGKRAACPACKQPVNIPALPPRAAAAPAAAAAPDPVDIEALAASALADEPAKQAEQPREVTFTCPYCDEEVHVSADLAGKQTPCPECRRIIKVPQLARGDPKDWRAAAPRGPIAARRDDEPAPEGAWGTANRPGVVSRESLEEAGAIPEKKEPVTVGQWVRRGVLIAGGLLVLVLGWVYVPRLLFTPLPEQALARAVAAADVKDAKAKLPPPWAGEVYRGVAEYRLRENKLDEATRYFGRARAQLQTGGASGADRDFFAIRLAESQLDLAGSPEQVKNETRLDWADATREALKTLRLIQDPEARQEGGRRVSLALLAKGQDRLAAGPAELANASEPVPKPGDKPGDKDKPPRPKLGGLLLALYKPDQAGVYLPAAADKAAARKADLATRCLYDSGWAPKHDFGAVRKYLVDSRDPRADRLACLLTAAVVAHARGQSEEARGGVADAAKLVQKAKKSETLSPWLLTDWALLAGRTGQTAEEQVFAQKLSTSALLSRVKLEKYRAEVAEKEPADGSWSQAVPDAKTLAHGLALELYTRAKAKSGGGSAAFQAVEDVKAEKVQPFGFVGVALGDQDRGR